MRFYKWKTLLPIILAKTSGYYGKRLYCDQCTNLSTITNSYKILKKYEIYIKVVHLKDKIPLPELTREYQDHSI